MIYISIYNTATGQILRRAMLDPEMIDANLADGEGWIEGFYDASAFTIQDGQAVAIDDSILQAASVQAAWADLRMTRDSLLAASDWTQAPDAPVDRQTWADYRQALRDLPANTQDPRNVDWPEPPK